jgi:hypothetical protein
MAVTRREQTKAGRARSTHCCEGPFPWITQETAMAPARNALLVLGMHRSGTSAFAGTLSRLGYALPARLMAPSPANANGYFESWEVAHLHDAILRTAATRWDDWSPISDAWFEQPLAGLHASRIVHILEREFAGHGDFLIKDPRACRLVPIWRRALTGFGARMLVVLPLRHPSAVARSLAIRDGLSLRGSHILWLRYMLDAERATRGLPRVFVPFETLLADWHGAVDGIAARLQVTWPRSAADAAPEIATFLDESLCHHRPEDLPMLVNNSLGDPLGALVGAAWEAFGRLASRGSGADMAACLEALRADLARLAGPRRLPPAIGAMAGRVIRRLSRFAPTIARNVGSGRVVRLPKI